MRNKEKKLQSSSSISELILSAVYFLQKRNGVTAKDITKYICNKRGYKQSRMKSKVKEALDRGTKNGIFNLKRGLYKVDENCKRKLTNLKKKVKKKTEAHKVQKKLTQKKVSVDNATIEDTKLTPINEDPNKSSIIFKPRVGSHSLSEDIFDRRGRENSYFEPSVLARPSDEEYDDFDDEDDNEDDEYSDVDEIDNRDIFTFTFSDEASRERFPDFNIYSAARQTTQKRVSTRKKRRNKSSNRGRGKKRKISKPRKKKLPEEEKKKSSEVESDDEDYFDEDESDYSEESEYENSKGRTKFSLHPEMKKSEEPEKQKLEEVSKSKENKDNKESKDGKEEADNKGNAKKKGKQTTVIVSKKFKNCESSEENMMDRKEDDLVEKSERSVSKSECMITSSTKLLSSDFKLSITPNMIVSDVKFSPTNIKFETQDSSTLLLADSIKNEPTDQEELFDDFKVFCECPPPKRKNSSSQVDLSSTRDAEPTQKRIKSKRSQK